MKNLPWNKLLIASILSGVMVIGCNKLLDISDDQIISEDHMVAEQSSEDVNTISDQSDVSETLKDLKTEDAANILGGGVVITRDKINNKVIIDFGTGYTAKNGRIYSGKVIRETNGKKYFEEGFVATITYDNFTVNGNSLTGMKTIKNMGFNEIYQMYWSIETKHTLAKTNGRSFEFTSSRTRTQIAGGETKETFSDDTYKVMGSGSGKASNGMTFEMNIIKPIIREMSCRYRGSGIIEYKRSGINTRTKSLDFGDGTCDNIAVLTVNGQTRTITLK